MKKKIYSSPKVTEIQLLPEEGILAYCRGAGTRRAAGRCQSTTNCTGRTANAGFS